MKPRNVSLRLNDMVEAAGHVRAVMDGVSIEAFESDWQKRWLVERGMEIISEASRHIPDSIKARHPAIPWHKVAGIGNVLRHDYERLAPDILWKLVRDDLPLLEQACRAELAIASGLKKK